MGKINHILRRLPTMAAVAIASTIISLSSLGGVITAQAADNRQALFESAAQEFRVPTSVLLAVSYNQSRWQSHGDEASVDGGYGLMNLTTTIAPDHDGHGHGDITRPTPKTSTSSKAHYTLDEAAKLLNVSPESLKGDDRQNIRGAAALLAEYAKQTNGGVLPTDLGAWYAAVAAYSGSKSDQNARAFADDVFATIQKGASLNTLDGQQLQLPAAQNVQPKSKDVTKLGLQAPEASSKKRTDVDCPRDLDCRFVPAGYAANSSDPTDFGNYDPASRPKDMKINTIVIHDTEGSYQSAIDHFQDTTAYVSGHYVIRSSDGAITQMVRTDDVAWCAGDWYVNMHSINIEHEGRAADGATWYTEAMYQSSARLVKYLAKKYNIPLDRQHIIGHDNVPSLSAGRLAGQHWDPGPYWDWNHYMELLNAPTDADTPVTNTSKVLTIAPTFTTNQPPVTDCSSGTCVTLPAQGTNFVYLRNAPQADAPFLSDKHLHPDGAPGTTEASDWSNKASTGQKYAVAGQQGDWTGIYFGGQVGWFYNPSGVDKTAKKSSGKTITPKAGLSSIPVYGAAYPEATAYPAEVPVQARNVLYDMPAGQTYVTSGGVVPTDYFYDMTINYSLPHDHEIIVGTEKFYQINFNHRVMFVKASDVTVKNN